MTKTIAMIPLNTFMIIQTFAIARAINDHSHEHHEDAMIILTAIMITMTVAMIVLEYAVMTAMIRQQEHIGTFL
jgi:hypothetical protein